MDRREWGDARGLIVSVVKFGGRVWRKRSVESPLRGSHLRESLKQKRRWIYPEMLPSTPPWEFNEFNEFNAETNKLLRVILGKSREGDHVHFEQGTCVEVPFKNLIEIIYHDEQL